MQAAVFLSITVCSPDIILKTLIKCYCLKVTMKINICFDNVLSLWPEGVNLF